MVGGAAAGSAAAAAAKEAARVEAEVLRERQLEAYEAFSHYANGYANDDVVRDRQLMPPPPPRPPKTGDFRRRLHDIERRYAPIQSTATLPSVGCTLIGHAAL